MPSRGITGGLNLLATAIVLEVLGKTYIELLQTRFLGTGPLLLRPEHRRRDLRGQSARRGDNPCRVAEDGRGARGDNRDISYRSRQLC